MTFGLSDEGFEVPRTADFLKQIENDYSTNTGLEIDYERDTFLGQMRAIVAARLGEVADAAQAVYDTIDPANATGAQLDNLGILVGVPRKLATFSQAIVALSGVVGTTILAGRIVQGGADTATRWRLDDDIVLETAVLATGDLSFTDGGTNFGRITRALGSWGDDGVGIGTVLAVAGSASNNKDFNVETIVSDTIIEVRQIVTTEGAVAATATGAFGTGVVIAEEKGAKAAAALAINTIATPVGGWQAVSNPAVASTGSDIETDDTYRVRRQNSLAVSGAASIKAIRSNLLELSFVTAAIVLENDTTLTAVIGGKTLPPKSLAAIVAPSTLTAAQQTEVIETIYNTAPAGIEIVGTDVTAVVTGSDGFPKDVAYDNATPLTVNVAATVVLATGFVLANVEASVQSLVTDYFNSLTVGQPVRLLELCARVATIGGVVGVVFTLNGSAADVVPLLSELATLGTNTVTE